MGNHVFICYARKDSEFVLKLATNLKSRGVPVWLDQWDIPAGANYNRTIDEAIAACAYFLLVLSPDAVDSVEVEGEWLMALEEKKTIVPVLHQDCRVPRQLRALHRVDFSGRNPDDETLLAQVVRSLGGQQKTSELQPTQLRHSRAGGNLEGKQGAGNRVSEQRNEAESKIKRPEEKRIITPSPFSEITNSTGMKLILIPAGEFLMGSENGVDAEKPVRKVIISKPFYLGKYPVTQAQWEAVMGSNPSRFKGELNRPVETVLWDEAQEFLRKVGTREVGKTYRLPTEAEWEYACRAGSTGAYFFGDDETKLKEYAWYDRNSGRTTHPVGKLKPNPWGLHDMHGNVWEWVQDWYADDYYKQRPNPDRDPQGPESGDLRVLRGGCLGDPQRNARCAFRYWGYPYDRFVIIGFRIVVRP